MIENHLPRQATWNDVKGESFIIYLLQDEVLIINKDMLDHENTISMDDNIAWNSIARNSFPNKKILPG